MPKQQLAVSSPISLADADPRMLGVIGEADCSSWGRDDFVGAGLEAVKVKYFSQWILGKLAHEYSGKWGDCSAFAREIHVEPNSLIVYRWVYRRITESKPDYVPDGYLTWGALQVIARQEKPIELIEELSGKGKVTIAEVTQHIKAGEGKELPRKPKVRVSFNEEMELWELEIDQGDFWMFNWRGKFGRRFYRYLRRVWKS